MLQRITGLTALEVQAAIEEILGIVGGGVAPVDAEYIVATPNATLTNERALTDNTHLDWNFSVAGQATATIVEPGLAAIIGLAKSDGNFIVGNGATWVAESAGTARTSLGLGASDTPQFAGVDIQATDTTITRFSAGNIAVEGNLVYRAGGTDVPVSDGGTGASSASAARTNLGLGTGDTPQFNGLDLGATDTTITRSAAGVIAVEGVVIPSISSTSTLTNKTLTSPLFTGVSGATHAAGKLVYDTDNECLTFFNNEADIGLQIGQEMYMRVRNSSGSTIANGAPVYVSGNHAGTGLPEISLARANAEGTAICVGLATHAIENNTIGYVTTEGTVHGLDTSAYANGDRLWLSAAAAGALVTTIPSGPNFRVRVGVVTKAAGGTAGSIYVNPAPVLAGYGTANQVAGMNSGATGIEYKTVSGTANQVTVTHGANSIALSAPQDIGTGSSPQFAGLNVGHASDTTLTRSAAGIIAVEGVDVPTISSTHTLSNKTLVAPALGTPASGVLSNCTGYTESITIACSDETTNLTTGTAKVTFRMPYAFTLTGVRANVNTAPTGSTIIVDINENGSTIMAVTKLSIDASEKTSTTAASAAVLSDTTLADDAEITIDIDQVGSTIPGKGLKVTLLGFRP